MAEMQFFADYVNYIVADDGECANRIYRRLWPDVLVGQGRGVAAMDAIQAEMTGRIVDPYQHIWLYLRFQLEGMMLEAFAPHLDWRDPRFHKGGARAVRARLNSILEFKPEIFQELDKDENAQAINGLAENCWVAACHFFQRRLTREVVFRLVKGMFKEGLVWAKEDSSSRQILSLYSYSW